MGLFGDYLVGTRYIRRMTEPPRAAIGRLYTDRSTILLGGPYIYGTALRENAVLNFMERSMQENVPAVMLSADPALPPELAQLPGRPNVVFGVNCSYDPFAACMGVQDVRRIMEAFSAAVRTEYNLPYPEQALSVLCFMANVLADSFGTDALRLSNLEALAAALESHYDIIGFLQWAEYTGYRVTQAMQNNLQNNWQTGVPGMTAMLGVLSRLLEAVRVQGGQYPEACIETAFTHYQAAAVCAALPQEGRDVLSVLLGTELLGIARRGGVFSLADFEVPLPECLRPFFYSGGAGNRFLVTALTLQEMNGSLHRVTLADMVPRADTVAVLGMTSGMESQAVSELFGTQQMQLMPYRSREGIQLSPMSAASMGAQVFLHTGIPDGGGVVIPVQEPTQAVRFAQLVPV